MSDDSDMDERLTDPEPIEQWDWSSDANKRWKFVCAQVHSYPYRVCVVLVCVVCGPRYKVVCVCGGENGNSSGVCVVLLLHRRYM